MNKTTKLSILGIAIAASFGANAGKTFEEAPNSTKPAPQSVQQRLDNLNRTELETPIPKPRSIRFKKRTVTETTETTEPPAYTENEENPFSYLENIPDPTYIEEVRKQRRIQLEREIEEIGTIGEWDSIDLYSFLSLENWLNTKKKYAHAGELTTAIKKMKQACSSENYDFAPVWYYKNIKIFQSSENKAEFLAKIKLEKVTVEMLINVDKFRNSQMRVYDHRRNEYSPFFHVTTRHDERVRDATQYDTTPVKSYKFENNELDLLEEGGVARFNWFKHFFLTSIAESQTIHYGIMHDKNGLPATIAQHIDVSKENPFLLAFTKIFELAPNKDIESRIIKSFYLENIETKIPKLAKRVERTADEHMQDLVADHAVFIENVAAKVNPYYIDDCLKAKDQLIRMLELKYNVISQLDDLDYDMRLKFVMKGPLSNKEFLRIEKKRKSFIKELNEAHNMVDEAQQVFDIVKNSRAYELYKKEEEE